MATTGQKKRSADPQTVTAAGWGKLGIHKITLPSGAVVKIRIPDLTLLLAAEAVPEDLRSIAFETVNEALRQQGAGGEPQVSAQELDATRLQRFGDLNRFLVSSMLVEPAMSMEELEQAQIPGEDLTMLMHIAARKTTVDARGVKIGIDSIDRWRLWREAHECPDDCEHCMRVVDALSSLPLPELAEIA